MANNKLVNGDVLQALITELEKRSIGSLKSTGSVITIKDLAGNIKDTLDVSIPSFTGATDSENGTSGLVPIPTAGKQDMALCGDATFKVLPISGGGTGATTKAGAQTNLGLNDAIVGLSVSGQTITYTQADGGTGEITTQDTNTVPSRYITSKYSSGTEWYVVYNDGWVRQGGIAPSSRGHVKLVTLLKPFKNTNYTVVGQAVEETGSNLRNGSTTDVVDKTATSFKIGIYGGGTDNNWIAEGQGA